jgi:hypothetical protein
MARTAGGGASVNVGSIALPRLRARRKRRKPPGPFFWWTLFNVIWCVAFTGFDLIEAFLRDLLFPLAFAGLQAAFLAYWWRLFRREWERWRRDDDDA